MPSTSGAQHRFMAKAMNDPQFASEHHIKPDVAAEFVHADKGSPWKKKDGGAVDKALHSARALVQREPRALGGGLADPYFAREEARGESQHQPYGFIASGVPGRTDRHDVDVASGSYVLPAEVVSGLGEGNSLAGARLTEMMFGSGPWGTNLPRGGRGSGPPRPPPVQQGLVNPGANQAESRGGRTHGTYAAYDRLHFAQGGYKHDMAPITVAGGEVILPPWVVAYHPLLGALHPGDTNPSHYKRALKHGHDILDSWVKTEIKRHAKTLQDLPGPAK